MNMTKRELLEIVTYAIDALYLYKTNPQHAAEHETVAYAERRLNNLFGIVERSTEVREPLVFDK